MVDDGERVSRGGARVPGGCGSDRTAILAVVRRRIASGEYDRPAVLDRVTRLIHASGDLWAPRYGLFRR